MSSYTGFPDIVSVTDYNTKPREVISDHMSSDRFTNDIIDRLSCCCFTLSLSLPLFIFLPHSFFIPHMVVTPNESVSLIVFDTVFCQICQYRRLIQ